MSNPADQLSKQRPDDETPAQVLWRGICEPWAMLAEMWKVITKFARGEK